MTILSGRAYWTHIVEPNNKGKFPSGKYEIVLGDLSADDIKKIKDMGFSNRLKVDADKGTNIKLKSKKQPIVIDKDKNPYSTVPFVGNKSKVKVQVNTYTAGSAGMQIGVNTIMITDLVEFKSRLVEFDEVDNDAPFDIED